MVLKSSYPTRAAAVADILAIGFTPARTDGFGSKASTYHDGCPCVALVKVTEQVVDACYNQPNYFTVDFV